MANTDLLLEWLVDSGTQWGTRIYSDGRVEEYSDKDMTFDGKDFITRRVPLQWRPLTHLAAAEQHRLTSAIAAAGFFALPAQVAPAPRLEDGTTSTWTVARDGKQHRVTAHEAGAAQNAALQQLGKVVQEVTAAALQRAGDSAAETPVAGEVC